MILLGMVACGGNKKNFKWEITQNIIKMSRAKRKKEKSLHYGKIFSSTKLCKIKRYLSFQLILSPEFEVGPPECGNSQCACFLLVTKILSALIGNSITKDLRKRLASVDSRTRMALVKKEAYFRSKTGRVTEDNCKAAPNKPTDFLHDLKA